MSSNPHPAKPSLNLYFWYSFWSYNFDFDNSSLTMGGQPFRKKVKNIIIFYLIFLDI